MKRHSSSMTAMIVLGALPISCGDDEQISLLEVALTIEAKGDGTTDPPPGTYLYKPGTVVTVTARPAPSADFAGWSGAASESDDAVSITVDGGKTLTAAFETASWPNEPQSTYLNPILPGDHPDMNIYIEGDDFYITGSRRVGSERALLPATPCPGPVLRGAEGVDGDAQPPVATTTPSRGRTAASTPS